MQDKEIIERVREDILLTYEEMGKVDFDMGSPFGLVDRGTVCVAVAKAQRDKILSYPNIAIMDPTKQAIIDLESLRKLTENQKE